LPKGPTLPIGESQPTKDKELTPTGKSGDKSENQNLAEILFSKSEIDADLRTVVERWEELSADLRRVIVKMVW
jgi:hypothetical protein